ncbi:MAG: heavy-metal-associated domain-containing protein [Phaeodactylibacter sp.]|nr:heavy-metal-associated domain-containing protein [Phaeodactylibacter sp.]MCB9293064.1 heavy-metal-associated domain-containing protein [Lewinellaceae bacterium]
MKKLILMFFLAVAGTAVANAQAAKACCAGKDKTACVKEGAAKAACCAKADKAGCAKMGTASADAAEATAIAGLATETFTVYGNCGMCKRKIEGAVSEVQGVEYANWDVASKVMTVKYEAGAVKLDDIKARIAAVGYDSETHRAPDEVYNNLHGCCQYERPRG